MEGSGPQEGAETRPHDAPSREQPARTTLNRMTIYEKAHIIGVRASQLSDDAPPLVDIGTMTDCIQIATKELVEKKLPFIVRRKLPDGTFEDWGIDELLIPEVDF